MEETTIYKTIEDMEKEEMARLYVELESAKPGTEQYEKILAAICKLRDKYNEANKIWVSRDELDQKTEAERQKTKLQKAELIFKIVSLVVTTTVTVVGGGTILKYNIAMGPISTRDAFNFLFRKTN